MSEPFYNQSRLSATVVASPESRMRELEQLAGECGCMLRAFGEDCDFVLIARQSKTDTDLGEWSEIADYLRSHDSEALVWSDLGELDAAYAALPADRCHYLVDAPDWQAAAILMGISRRIRRSNVKEASRDSETVALHRISSELADFARTLARIAEQEANGGGAVRDKPVSFRPAPQDLFDTFGKVAPAPVAKRANDSRTIIKLRRMRDRFFAPALFADPGWDILLDLYAAEAEGKPVSVSSLCIAAAVPPTTALRWITNMTSDGLLVRVQDPGDARRVFIELAPETRRQMDAYFDAIAQIDRQPI